MTLKHTFTIKSTGRLKARICCRGFDEDASKNECYSATPHIESIRLFFAIAAMLRTAQQANRQDLVPELQLIDFSNAFLNATIKDEDNLYVRPPTGIKLAPNMICSCMRLGICAKE
eukprot:CAMPEP_0203774270 /NCGR_PEP_ID=MMETSP0099_2-20121227/5200_1 /ASSEMBLY_ACC=CAM_ASM_000209 /TAXON_ID=96639 /ORGANISM=" , Strain NY0313808BC1" /LENGTH=115 /DNA_ID=CAMNT_0050672353 /DNA_START=128 /DNA_END=475 /DNA_ORIENTATION=-